MWLSLYEASSCRMRRGVGQAIAAFVRKGRKVRAPKGRVPDNVWAARADDKCSREKTA